MKSIPHDRQKNTYTKVMRRLEQGPAETRKEQLLDTRGFCEITGYKWRQG